MPTGQPNPDLLDWIDDIADGFEAAWKKGSPPSIRSLLGTVHEPGRPFLLRELVLIDLEYRRRAGERRRLEDYLKEFPDLGGPDGSLPDGLVLKALAIRDRYDGAGPPPAPEASGGFVGSSCRDPSGKPSAFPSDSPAESLPRTLGRFQLLELLGTGSFGAVYKARDAELCRTVAVKLPRPGYFHRPELRERFLREARSAAQLSHPHIVKVHEIAHEGDLPYLVSDYIPGHTLADVLKTRKVDFREAAELAAQVAEALDFAHRHKIVHRDVNPRNILIDGAGQAHVTDFGLARREEGETLATLEGQVLGTPAYMAPEQAAGEPGKVDARSDVYGLGAVLYELLTSELPFRGSVRMLLHQVVHDEPRPPRRLNDRVPRDLETICLKAMAKSPARRYAAAGDLATDLRRYLKGEPIQARPVGSAERFWRWCRRNPVVAGLTASVAALLIVATGLALRRAAIADELAERQRRSKEAAESGLRREQELRARMQASHGNLLLETGNSLGLLHLLEAGGEVRENLRAAASHARLWSGGFAALNRQLLRLVQVVGHPSAVRSCLFSPDGKYLATRSADGTVRLWDAVTGRPIGPPIAQDPGYPRSPLMAFRPGSRLLAVVTRDRSVQRVDAATARPVGPPLIHSAAVQYVHFSPDGKWLATLSSGGGLQLWEADTGRRHGRAIRLAGTDQLVFSPDGRRLAAPGGHERDCGVVHLLDVPSLRVVRPATAEHRGLVVALAFSPDGKRFATGSWDHTARLWDTASGKPTSAPFPHAEDVRSVAFHPSRPLLATASFDGTVRLLDFSTGGRLGLVRDLPHRSPVLSIAFSPDGLLLASACFDNTVSLWEVQRGKRHGWPLCHQGPIHSLAFAPSGRRLVTAAADGTARVWSVAAPGGGVLRHRERVWSVAFSPDGKRLATGSEDGLTQLWDVRSGESCGQPMRQPVEPSGLCQSLGVAISPDGTILASAGASTVQLWSLAAGRPQRKLRTVHGGRFLTFSRDGKLLVTCKETLCRIWDSRRWTPHCPPIAVTQGHIDCMDIGPDGQRVALGTTGGLVRLYETAGGKELQRPLRHRGQVEAVAFSPDGRWLATGSRDDLTVRLWDTSTWKPHGAPFGQQAFTQALAFSPDSNLLAVGSADGLVRLIDIATGLSCGPPLRHGMFVTSVAFSPDGRRLATGSFDKTVRLWPVPRLVPDLREMELRTWVALGARRKAGAVEAIPWEEWQGLRAELKDLTTRTPKKGRGRPSVKS
jgi:WD40 repeat protein